MQGRTFLISVIAITVASAATPRAEDAAYQISATKPPYFVCDERVVEDRWQVVRFVMPLRKHAQNPLIVKEHAWEGSGPHMGGSVLYDSQDTLYKMWYSVFNRYNYDSKLPFSYNVCYAESDDGIAWRKPALGVFDSDRDPANNCIHLGTDKTQNIDVMLNPLPDVYPGRFLAIHNQKGGVFVSHSDDGKRFTFLQDAPAIQYHSDTHNNVVYDEVRDRWLLYCRPRAYAGDHRRRVALQAAPSLRAWEHERTILVPREDETPEFYGMTVFRAGDLFFGVLQCFDRETGFMVPELRWSGDGVHWDCVGTHPLFLERGPEGAWDHGMVMLAESPVCVGDEWRFYYGGFAESHDSDTNPCAIGLATAARDRLVGVRPNAAVSGYVLTRPFRRGAEAELTINVIIEDDGALRAELRDDGNRPIEGFAMDDCVPVTTSGFEQRLVWGDRSLRDAPLQDLRIRFELDRAQLFTFGF